MFAAWPQIRSREIGGKALVKALAEHAEMQVKFDQLDEFAEGFAAAVGKLPAKNKVLPGFKAQNPASLFHSDFGNNPSLEPILFYEQFLWQ